MTRALTLLPLALAAASRLCAQVPCPIALLDAKADKDSIRLEFLNKGKVPVQQMTFACTPSGANKFPNDVCHVETGIAYPGSTSWIRIDYVGATRRPVEITVTELRLSGGILWQPSTGNRCKAIRSNRSGAK